MMHRTRRAGYTLLELILALAIGMVLMGALYVVLNLQMSSAQTGRDSIQEATLARAILARMASDITGSLATYDPSQVPEASATGASSDATGEAAEGATTGGTTSSATPSTTTSSGIVFNYGLEGETDRLILRTGRVPLELLAPDKIRVDSTTLQRVSDLRRISYWVIEGKGLARQELTAVTSTELDATPPDVDQPEKFVIAPEVKSITLSYWNGTAWDTEWISYDPLSDAPVGPPAAVQIVIEFRPSGEQTEGTKYRQTVTLPTGNNYSTQATQ